MRRLKYLFTLFIVLGPSMIYGQCPVADFSIPDTVCIGENIKIINNSISGVQYEWDFCAGDLQNLPLKVDALANGLFNKPTNITLVKEDENWYGFIASRFGKRIVRLDFGSDLLNTPTVVDLGTFNNSFIQPIDIEFVSEGDNWYALLVDVSSNKLWRLSFNTLADNTPSLEPLNIFNSNNFLNAPVDIEIIEENNNLTAIVSNYFDANITQITFGNSITNNPIGTNINVPSAINLQGVSTLKFCNIWNVLLTSTGNHKIFTLKYSNGLSSPPTIAEVVPNGVSISSPVGIDLINENATIYAFVQSAGGNLYRLANAENLAPTGTNLGNLSGLTSANEGLKIIQSRSNWYGFLVNINANSITRIQFPGNCYSNTDFSILQDPADISYSQSGNYHISLNAYDSIGNFNAISKPVTVLNILAPSIDMKVLNSQCLNAAATFQASGSDSLTISSWQWSFGDNSTVTGQEVTHQYSAPGTYQITLEVKSENDCSNRITKEITIYEPPDPQFSIPDGLLCSNGAIAFTNLTDAKGADDLITYQWDFNGEGTSTAINPSFTFTTGGTKTVTLTASIPGCSQTYSLSFDVAQGPVVGFEVPYICQGVEVQLENVTQGEYITSYHWDFGDGGSYTSTSAVSPFYNYQLAGAYTVVLTVENASGCINTFSRTVQVHARPQVNFLAEVACVGTPVRFTDQTTSGTTSNVVDWLWDFGDGKGTANIKNPAYTYTHPGTYQVKLVAQTSAGCKDSLIQDIILETPVIADFTPEVVCQAEGSASYTVQFHDQSTVAVGNRITQWLWTIQGENFTTQDVQYIFDTPGVYEVTLTTTAASACNATITQTIEVLAEPEVAFDYTQACAGVPFSFINQTISQEGVISRYSWDFGGVGASFDRDPEFTFTHPGNYTVRLMAQTQDGCIFSSEQQVSVPAQPVAQFTPSVTFGAYPLTVQFNNQSTDATQYIWQIGEEDTLTETSPVYTFTQPGQYNVILTAVHESGCLSIENQQITVVDPVWDLVMESIRILPAEENGAYQVVLTIRNAGTVAVAHFPMSIKVDQLLELKENFQGHLAPGEKISYPVSFTLSNQFNQNVSVRYICATLLNGDVNLPDIHLTDSRACANMSGDFNSIVPYPNPVKDVLDVSLVLPQVEPVTMMINNSKGSQMKAYHFTETRRGLNSFALDMSGLAQGVYLVQIHYLGKVKTYRVVVQP